MSWGRMALLSAAVGAGLAGTALIEAASYSSWVEAQEKQPTAREVVAAIQEHVGVPWKTETVDTFKAGNPETRVTGVAGTVMASLDVLPRASATRRKPITTHETAV